MKRRSHHETLTDPRLERILGTMTPRAWRKLAVLATRNEFFDLDIPIEKVASPTDHLIHEARQSSGSIHGEHRRDLVEAIKGADQPVMGLGVPPPEKEAEPERRSFL